MLYFADGQNNDLINKIQTLGGWIVQDFGFNLNK